MLKLNPTFSFGEIMGSPENFKTMVEKATPVISDLLNNNCFTETDSTRKIETLAWPCAVPFLTLRTNSCLIDEDQIVKEIDRQYP